MESRTVVLAKVKIFIKNNNAANNMTLGLKIKAALHTNMYKSTSNETIEIILIKHLTKIEHLELQLK